MTLRDILKKREKVQESSHNATPTGAESPPPFTIMRSDTNTQEIISPPTFHEPEAPHKSVEHSAHRRFSRFRSPSSASAVSQTPDKNAQTSDKSERRLSQRLHLRSHSRNSSQGSVNVPDNLPEIQDLAVHGDEKQAEWEKRATILAKENPNKRPVSRDRSSRLRQSSPSRSGPNIHVQAGAHLGDRPIVTRTISDAKGDESIQEAIRLHEAGDLKQSTAMFGRLADTNAMAQIMYGLALRHGWGIDPNPSLAVKFLSEAASNSANVEATALSAGKTKGGAAKGELVLAIYELANSFRHGWGVEKDDVAARKYYECAANLGDTDAMNEVASCYEHGVGGKKDKFVAAQYYRLAEENGNKTLGNSWIWKDKYSPTSPSSAEKSDKSGAAAGRH